MRNAGGGAACTGDLDDRQIGAAKMTQRHCQERPQPYPDPQASAKSFQTRKPTAYPHLEKQHETHASH